MALTTTPGNTTIPSTDLTATATSIGRQTMLIIAAAVPSGIAFILAIALITVIACWCRSRRRIKKLKKRPKKTSVAVSLETLEDARARSLREAQANRLQLLENGANELGLGQTNPQDVQHDEYYGNSSDLPQSPVEVSARQSEIDDGDYVNVEPTVVVPARVRVPVQDDQDDEDDELDYENVAAPIQVPVMRPKRKNSDDDEKDEHDYVNVPKGGKPGTSPERAPVLARVSHLLQD